MTIQAKQKPMRLKNAGKRDVRTQFGALPWRERDGKVQVLLITSRGTGRWILPKGWPMDGATPSKAAATEAWEEAGVIGKPSNVVLGFYSYRKRHEDDNLPIVVAVFPIKVRKVAKDFPEAGQRKRKWVSLKRAEKLLMEPELRAIVRHFKPSQLKS
ncbi:MAG: NUDIX hydrolase [Maritimibacter sp.]